MGRPLKKTMSDGKREIISRLISEYDIHSVGDIEEALKDLLGGTIKGMMEAEMENQKEETQKTEPDYSDQRNGYKTKTVRSNYGPVEIDVPQDRKSDYEPKIVPKYSRDISGIDDKIIRMYAGGMSVSEISEQIEEIYGFDVSEGLVTGVTNKILPKIDEWQRRPLCPVSPFSRLRLPRSSSPVSCTALARGWNASAWSDPVLRPMARAGKPTPSRLAWSAASLLKAVSARFRALSSVCWCLPH